MSALVGFQIPDLRARRTFLLLVHNHGRVVGPHGEGAAAEGHTVVDEPVGIEHLVLLHHRAVPLAEDGGGVAERLDRPHERSSTGVSDTPVPIQYKTPARPGW